LGVLGGRAIGGGVRWCVRHGYRRMHLIERDSGDLGTLNSRIRAERDAEQRDQFCAVVLAIEGRETADIK
jgi:hypothetical protein